MTECKACYLSCKSKNEGTQKEPCSSMPFLFARKINHPFTTLSSVIRSVYHAKQNLSTLLDKRLPVQRRVQRGDNSFLIRFSAHLFSYGKVQAVNISYKQSLVRFSCSFVPYDRTHIATLRRLLSRNQLCPFFVHGLTLSLKSVTIGRFYHNIIAPMFFI